MASGLLRARIARAGNGRRIHARFRPCRTSAREIRRIFDLASPEEIAGEAFVHEMTRLWSGIGSTEVRDDDA